MPLSTSEDADKAKSAYDFIVADEYNREYDLSQRRGYPTLFFNSATGCGFFANSITNAVKLHKKYRENGFLPIAFPSNSFNQEPINDVAEIKKTACSTAEVEFPFMGKIEVNGENASPLWKWLQKEKTGFMFTAFIKWNFTSFLCDAEGKVVERFSPGMSYADIDAKLAALVDRVPSRQVSTAAFSTPKQQQILGSKNSIDSTGFESDRQKEKEKMNENDDGEVKKSDELASSNSGPKEGVAEDKEHGSSRQREEKETGCC
jgi:glutathione peroxidase